ncbi:hypothetical protein ACTXGU_21735 [Niallia sp. 01092]
MTDKNLLLISYPSDEEIKKQISIILNKALSIPQNNQNSNIPAHPINNKS